MERFMRSLVLVVGFALIAAACGEEGGLVVNTTTTTVPTTTATTTTTVPTTTTTPPTSTTVLDDFAVDVDMAFAYRVEADGTCVTTSYEGVDYGFIAEGEELVIEDFETGEILGSYPLGEGTEQPSRYGPDVCRFETTASLPTNGSYRFYLADDTAGFTGTYTSEEDGSVDFGGHLFYPLGVEVGRGIDIIPSELYPTAVPIWQSDIARAMVNYDPRWEDKLVGVGFTPPPGTTIRSPISGYLTTYSFQGEYIWRDIYVDDAHPRVDTKVLWIFGIRLGESATPAVGDFAMMVYSAGRAIDTTGEMSDVPVVAGQNIGTVTSPQSALPIVTDGVGLLIVFLSVEEDGVYRRSEGATLPFFPYLEAGLEQPVSDWSPGVTVVVSDDCDTCDEILAELSTVPDSLEVHVVNLEDRVVRYFGIREAPTVTIRGLGEYDLVTRSGLDAVDQLQELVEKACGWFNC